MQWIDDHYCFICGKNNPDGFKLDFTIKDKKIYTECVFPKKYQGYKDIVHGGMISMILDEVMALLPIKLYNVMVVSAELNVKLKKPVKINEKVTFVAEIEKEYRNLIYTKAQALLENGEIAATATAKCLRV